MTGSDMDALLDELIRQLDGVTPRQITLESGDFSYVICCEKPRQWLVRKLVGEGAVDYTVRPLSSGWTCTCPAGMHGRKCKHVEWVNAIASSRAWRKKLL